MTLEPHRVRNVIVAGVDWFGASHSNQTHNLKVAGRAMPGPSTSGQKKKKEKKGMDEDVRVSSNSIILLGARKQFVVLVGPVGWSVSLASPDIDITG